MASAPVIPMKRNSNASVGQEMPSSSASEPHGAFQQDPVEGSPAGDVSVPMHAEEATARLAQDETTPVGQAFASKIGDVTTETSMVGPTVPFEDAQRTPHIRDVEQEPHKGPGEGQPRWGGLWAYISGADKASDGHEQPGT